MRVLSIAFLFIFLFATAGFAADIFVSASGSDRNAGTADSPLATVQMALRKARELRRLNAPSIINGITIFLGGGTYRLEEPIVLRPEDSGTAASPTRIENLDAKPVIISGGVRISGWTKLKAGIPGLSARAVGKVWVADAPVIAGRVMDFRQLWINSRKALRAQHTADGKMDRILSWNKGDETCEIPLPKPGFRFQPGMELFIQQWWAIAILRIKNAVVTGNKVRLSFFQPESRVQSEHPWPAPWLSKQTGNSAFRLTNSLQFVDQPGEWYLDQRAGKLYYWPLSGENMPGAEVIAPALETLLSVRGTIDRPVAHVTFQGISFRYSTWLLPSQQGLVPHQAGMYMTDAYKLKIPGTPDKKSLENQAWVGRPAAAVDLNYAQAITFERCRFEHLASTGLDLHHGIKSGLVRACYFRDIGGSGVLAGVFSEPGQEVHLPYNPKDEREVTEAIAILNSRITDATNEDWGSVGIGFGFVRNGTIAHNEITEVSYTGISSGWGWTPTANASRETLIAANSIRRYGKHLYDVAGIYTLSAQAGAVIRNNYIDSIYKAPYPHDPNHWFYLYTDEGSSGITVKNNWTPSEKYLQNANGPGNTWMNNGPQVADSVRKSAGIPPSIAQDLPPAAPVSKGWTINKTERTRAIEVVMPSGTKPPTDRLNTLATRSGLPVGSVFTWKNRAVIYGRIENPEGLALAIPTMIPGATVRRYDTPFYEFSRAKNCPEGTVAKEWDHILLSANLVADTVLQKEYMSYHANQFKEWPEVSNGFCKADFQQLLVFRNGRQLMLVISIPKGESLDKLNPKTTENNPRVDDWNKLMSKYQEGIEGTGKGETWVFLKKDQE